MLEHSHGTSQLRRPVLRMGKLCPNSLILLPQLYSSMPLSAVQAYYLDTLIGYSNSFHTKCKSSKRGKPPRDPSAKELKTSTCIRMSQQHHRKGLSQPSSQCSCNSDETQRLAPKPKHNSDSTSQSSTQRDRSTELQRFQRGT